MYFFCKFWIANKIFTLHVHKTQANKVYCRRIFKILTISYDKTKHLFIWTEKEWEGSNNAPSFCKNTQSLIYLIIE